MNICARCRNRAAPLITRLKICLPCVEELVEHGGKWSTGDDIFLAAVREMYDEMMCRKKAEARARRNQQRAAR